MILQPPLWATDAWEPDAWADGTWATTVVPDVEPTAYARIIVPKRPRWIVVPAEPRRMTR